MAIELRCIEEGHTDKRWLLEIRGQMCVLLDIAGGVVAKFGRDEARRRFRTPSLTEEIKHFAIALEEQTVRFDVNPGGLAQIEEFVHRPGPPAAIAAMQLDKQAELHGELKLLERRKRKDRRRFPGLPRPVMAGFAAVSALFTLGMAFRFMTMTRTGAHHTTDAILVLAGVVVGAVAAITCIRSALRRPEPHQLVADG